jgi:isopenicillin-N N-acyltransferase-like protein
VGGIFISVGYNAAGLSLTGNELSPNDDRVGVPRLLVVRDILSRPSASEAVAAACNPARASSYNNLIAHADGTIVNVEGSGGAYGLLPAEDGWTVHTNHYVHPAMGPYEADPGAIRGSEARYRRARALMEGRDGPVTPAMLRAFLADREGAPDCLCKVAGDGEVQTVFWCIIGLNRGEIRFGRDPRAPHEQHFQFG